MKPKYSGAWLCGLACLLVAGGTVTAVRGDEPDCELKDETGKTIIHYVAEPPAGIAPAGTTDPAKQVGLFLCFPEHGHPTGEEMVPVRDSLERQKLRGNFVLIAAHSQSANGKFLDIDHEPIEKLIEWAKKTYPINPRRVYMFGRGEGAKISGEFAATHPNLITASILYSWGFWKMPAEVKDPLNTAPEFYMNLGLKDLPHHLTTVRDTYSRVKAKGYHVIYREFADFGAKTYFPTSNDDAIAWATRLRNKNLAPSPQEAALLHGAAPRVVRAPGTEAFASLVLVGGPPAGAVVQQFLISKDATLRTGAAEACGRAMFGEATVTALAKRLTDPSPKVRQAVIAALGTDAGWRSEAAQQALIRFATTPDPKADIAERLSAVDALGAAMKLQAQGVRQDPAVFKALVALLDAPDERLRAHAFAILSPIRASEYKPEAPQAERTPALAGWQQWLEQITAAEEAYGKPMP